MPIFTSLINFIFPPLCVHCGREGSWLCPVAREELAEAPIMVDPIVIPGIDRVIVRGSYDCAPLAQFILKLKYHYWTGAAAVLNEALRPLSPHLKHKNTLIVPVPLHRRRQQERGFNQSMYIARSLSTMTGLPVNNILQRTRYTTPQAQLSAKQRIKNIIGAFGDQQIMQWPTSVILVDDVITTGSTIAECADVLRKKGVQKITAVALAKG